MRLYLPFLILSGSLCFADPLLMREVAVNQQLYNLSSVVESLLEPAGPRARQIDRWIEASASREALALAVDSLYLHTLDPHTAEELMEISNLLHQQSDEVDSVVEELWARLGEWLRLDDDTRAVLREVDRRLAALITQSNARLQLLRTSRHTCWLSLAP